MADSFTYDLVSFLRVLYRRRWFILQGTAAVTILVMIASLLWPQTWRAEARILVSTPKYKKTLQLIPEPFDVLTYRGIMSANSLFSELLQTLKWYKTAINELKQEENLNRLKDHLREKAAQLSTYQLIENTNIPLLSSILLSRGMQDDPKWQTRIDLLGHLSDEQMKELDTMDMEEIDDISVFDLRKMLSANVSVVKETNLETVYSRLISVSAEFNTAAGSAMLANTWVGLFMARAERIVKETVQRQVRFTRQQAAELEVKLATQEAKITVYRNEHDIEALKAQTASNLIALTGVAPSRQKENLQDESFDLENENEPFMKEHRRQWDRLSYYVVPEYENALLPKKVELEREKTLLQSLIKSPLQSRMVADVSAQYQKVETQLQAVNRQIDDLKNEIQQDMQTIRKHEAVLDAMNRGKQQILSSLTAMQPMLDEAAILESREGDFRYADVSADRAIKPDKRVFPKRSLMTIAGCAVSLILFCALAFFLDIWKEVVRPEEG